MAASNASVAGLQRPQTSTLHYFSSSVTGSTPAGGVRSPACGASVMTQLAGMPLDNDRSNSDNNNNLPHYNSNSIRGANGILGAGVDNGFKFSSNNNFNRGGTNRITDSHLDNFQFTTKTNANLSNGFLVPGAYNDLNSSAMDGDLPAAVAQMVQTAPPGHQLHEPLRMSLAQLQALGSCMLGWQVLVQSSEGSYVGYICWMLEHCSRLGLEEVSRPETGMRRVGLVLLYYRTIESVTLLGKRAVSRARVQKSNVLEEQRGRSLLMKKLAQPHLEEKWRRQQQGEDVEQGPPPPLPLPVGRLSRPNDWRVVDELGDGYQQAIIDISSFRRVGLSTFGHKLGRFGELAWLCVATPSVVYLFDAATLGLHALLYGRRKEQHNKTSKQKPAEDQDVKTGKQTKPADDPSQIKENNRTDLDKDAKVPADTKEDDLHSTRSDLSPPPAAVSEQRELDGPQSNVSDATGRVPEKTSDLDSNAGLAEEKIIPETVTRVNSVCSVCSDASVELENSQQDRDTGQPILEPIIPSVRVTLGNCETSETSERLQPQHSDQQLLKAMTPGIVTLENCADTNSSEKLEDNQQDRDKAKQLKEGIVPAKVNRHNAAHSNSSEDLQQGQSIEQQPPVHLSMILEDPGVEIVIHDSRNLADLLHHSAGVRMQSIFDTQAAEVYLELLANKGDCPAFVPPLGGLLVRRLHLTPQHLLWEAVHGRHGGDSSLYFERPVAAPTLGGLASSAMFLCELRHLQLRELLADLRQLTAVHTAAHLLKDDVTRGRVEQHVVPEAVQRLGRRTVLNCTPSSIGGKGAWGAYPGRS